MRLKLFATIAGVSLFSALVVAQNSKQIQVFASILDGTGAPAKTVEAGDIRLMENGADAKVTKVEAVNWPGMQYRHDIGHRAIEREQAARGR